MKKQQASGERKQLNSNTSASTNHIGSDSPTSKDKQQQDRVLITGDDILIEYVERLMTEIKPI